MTSITNIILAEPSVIICQGLTSVLSNAGLKYKITAVDSLRQLEVSISRISPDIVLVNPAVIQNQAGEFHAIRKKLPAARWTAIVYALTDPQIMALFDEIIYINDSAEKIAGTVQRLLSPDHRIKSGQEHLSARETDVLKLLVAGLSNKEIAGKLNISIHTVITHRKNISQKTGIRSASGLTIYAVLKEIISVNDYRE